MNRTLNTVEDIRLIAIRPTAVNELAGYMKHHRVSDELSETDMRFIEQMATKDIEQDLDEVYAKLRSEFGLIRKQMEVTSPDNGFGAIETPFFEYEIALSKDPSQNGLCWLRSIARIRNSEAVLSEKFAKVFRHGFSEMELSVAMLLNIEAIVDHIEEIGSDEILVDYPRDLSWCDTTVAGRKSKVRFADNTIRVVQKSASPPQHLLNSYLDIQRQLAEVLNFESNEFLESPVSNQ